MADGISKIAEQGVPALIPDCYQGFCMNDKSRILDELIDVAGRHREHGNRLLGDRSPERTVAWPPGPARQRRGCPRDRNPDLGRFEPHLRQPPESDLALLDWVHGPTRPPWSGPRG